MRGADLTPTDEVVALLLLAAHQRNMRRRHIKRKLADKSCCNQPNLQLPESQNSPHIQQQQQQQQPQPGLLKHGQNGDLEAGEAQHSEQDGQKQWSRSSNELQQNSTGTSLHTSLSVPGSTSLKSSCSAQQAAPEAQVVASGCCAERQRVTLQQQKGPDEGQQQDGEYLKACSKHLQEINDNSQVHQQAATSTHQHGSQQQNSKAGKQEIKRSKLKQTHVPAGVDVEQGWGAGNDAEGSDVDYDADDDPVSMFSEQSRGCGFPCVITPSSMAAELAPDLTQQEAANLYLGQPA